MAGAHIPLCRGDLPMRLGATFLIWQCAADACALPALVAGLLANLSSERVQANGGCAHIRKVRGSKGAPGKSRARNTPLAHAYVR